MRVEEALFAIGKRRRLLSAACNDLARSLASLAVLRRRVSLRKGRTADDKRFKMVDFGLCKDEIFGNKMTNTFCGTPSYLPPEVVCNMKYGRAVDWWGLGVVIYELLTGIKVLSKCF